MIILSKQKTIFLRQSEDNRPVSSIGLSKKSPHSPLSLTTLENACIPKTYTDLISVSRNGNFSECHLQIPPPRSNSSTVHPLNIFNTS